MQNKEKNKRAPVKNVQKIVDSLKNNNKDIGLFSLKKKKKHSWAPDFFHGNFNTDSSFLFHKTVMIR